MPTETPFEGDKRAPRSRKGLETRARLLGAAKQIFEENGFLDARISDISERAGLSHGSFYHYFDSKEQIFREVAELVDDQLAEPLDRVILAPSSATPRERLREAMRLHFASYREEARMMGLIEQVSRYDEDVRTARRARHKRYSDLVASSIEHLQTRGLADPTLDPTIAAAALGAMTWRFAEIWLVQGLLECDFDDAVDQLANTFANMLQLKDETELPRRRLRVT